MKNIIIIFILLYSITNHSQESFLKKYKIDINNCCKKLYCNKKVKIEFKDFSLEEKQELKKKHKENTLLHYTSEEIINGKKVILNNSIFVDSIFYSKQTITKTKEVNKNNFHYRKGHVKMIGDKLYVNPINSDRLYYYKLTSGEEFKLKFTEVTVSALTIPLKYRFKVNDSISENYTASINLNGFLGISTGKSNFMYRKGVDSKINTEKYSFGVLGGFSTVKLTTKNSKILEKKLNNNGLLSVGIGATYSFNKINVGGFYGYDFALGQDATDWNYNGKPWLGIALGYSLFKL